MRAAPLLGLVLVVLGTSACGSLAEAQQVIGRADLVNDLSARLSAAEELTYSADYQLPGGKTASMARAQDPPRSAYTYPGGKLIVTGTETTECAIAGPAASCAVTPPPSPSANPTGGLFTEPGRHGLIPPTVVVSLLTAAALDPDAVIEQNDTTVAGEHATCLNVRAVENAPASAFEACITTAGVLGGFSGVVNGNQVELTLTRYSDTVDAAVFDLPTGAKIIR
ncbi:MAG TPA: hypothetical protein VFT95_19165 [Micromonosporaceae bacterium]|nr:hypothetical protein [Micromonosporaceae bacterium]